MTGRDLIIYILENNLEDQPILNDDEILGFVSIERVALKLGVGVQTVKTWMELDNIPNIKLNDTIYITIKDAFSTTTDHNF